MTELEKYISGYFAVDKEEAAAIAALFRPEQLRKGDYYLKAGRYCDRMAFVQAGIVREYVIVNDKEVTKWISTPGYFVLDLAGFLFRQPSRWNIHALTDCELLVLDRQDYERMPSIIPGWPELEKLFIARCFTILEERVLTLIALSAEERYEKLFAYNSELFNAVPLQYLASMLGMTPETLSRLRKKRISTS